ncbi:helix-turn-helix domain-containing protein [Curtobacterium citreum]|uniref:helix-turn-helix domain-containing protein n=1 Tax=Curtobacterium citreum TaxID=2036 RepID=UPI00254A0208|nr:helix-turn-helix domain-containing protein [Curtobacterium citreum]MDK8172188.1 helix-turn-helix domain-containing protein [Curtobacterium citreum]
MDGISDEFLNVRETAKRLDVHENTVRNWVKAGQLPDARLPGSRFHRFRLADVERLIAARGAVTTPSLQTERRMFNPELVTASQLSQWATARQRDAQEHFPELVRRLLAETPGVSNISVRAGDGVALPGWDGRAESSGSAFLPSGLLALEFGVDKSPKGKASEDYAKRSEQTPSDITFVFVTPRRWAGGAAWAVERRAEGHFADVRVIDADDLEGWLQASPAAHHWISEHLGLRPRDAQTIDAWWGGLKASADPALPITLFLAGRLTEAQKLKQRLSAPAQLTVVQSEWDQDVLGFIHAALQTQFDSAGELAPALLIIRSAEVWDRVVEQPGRSVLIPLFEGPSLDTAINRGHHVIIVVERSTVTRRAVDLPLPRLERLAAAEAFREAIVPFNRADRLAVLGRRSMPALVRYLSRDPRIRRPNWAEQPDASILAPLAIIGSWTENAADLAVIEQVTGRSWQEVEQTVQRVSMSGDPVLRKIGSQWSFVSPEEAFLLLRDSISPSTLERWAEQVSNVMLLKDSILELDGSARLLARMNGEGRPHSAVLRRGLARGFALMGSMGVDTFADGSRSLADLAAALVSRLLETANADASGRTWQVLAEVLPLLAEAAPDAFLTALEDDLTSESAVVLRLFQEEDGLAGFGPSSPHPSLLWAIETVCWSPLHLVQGAQVLAHLAVLDPGGRTANRPRASLAAVLCGWVQNTAASLEVRLEAIAAVERISDAVGWRLILELWPSGQRSVIPPASPHFRDDWSPSSRSVSMADWIATVRRLVDSAIRLAAGSPARLAELVGNISTVPEDDRARIVIFLESQAIEDLGSEGRLQVWEKLQAETTRHERYAASEWAMPPSTLAQLKAVTALFEPASDPLRFSFLFGWHPDLPGVDKRDFERHEVEVEQRRKEALSGILARDDAAAQLTRLARRAPVPRHLGWALASQPQVGLTEMLPWLGSDDQALREAAASWAHKTMLDQDATWLHSVLAHQELVGQARALLVRQAPARKAFWDVLHESADTNDEVEYWTNAAVVVVERKDTPLALDQLITHGRAWDAIPVAAHALNRPRGQDSDQPVLETKYILDVLDEALQQSPSSDQLSDMDSYYVGELLDFLADAQADAQADVARLEYAFFCLLEHTREPTALNHFLANDPATFITLVQQAYRGKSQELQASDKAKQDAASQAWWVLQSWTDFPGRRNDGSIDGALMEKWVKEARLQLSDSDRGDIGDEAIGHALAHTPLGDDGAWPAEPVRQLIEMIGSRDLENGLAIGRTNARGVTSRGPYDGGGQERDLAAQYLSWSALVRARWPRTARILRAIAESYERDARYHDVQADLDADRD